MTQEYEDITCFACGQVRGKRKVVHLSEDDKVQFAVLETKIKGHNCFFSTPETWIMLAGLLPVLAIIVVVFCDISALEAWPQDNLLRVILPYYTLWAAMFLWTSHREFKKNQARLQALFHQEKDILSKYGVEAKDDYIIR